MQQRLCSTKIMMVKISLHSWQHCCWGCENFDGEATILASTECLLTITHTLQSSSAKTLLVLMIRQWHNSPTALAWVNSENGKIAIFLTTMEHLLQQMQGYAKDFKCAIDVRYFFGACKVKTPLQILKLQERNRQTFWRSLWRGKAVIRTYYLNESCFFHLSFDRSWGLLSTKVKKPLLST